MPARDCDGDCENASADDDATALLANPSGGRLYIMESAYEGGGVRFRCLPSVVNRDAGHVIAFAGGLEHAGHPISAGTRYILAVFVYCALNESGRETGYSLLAAAEGGNASAAGAGG